MDPLVMDSLVWVFLVLLVTAGLTALIKYGGPAIEDFLDRREK